jgi:hypothetical protein
VAAAREAFLAELQKCSSPAHPTAHWCRYPGSDACGSTRRHLLPGVNVIRFERRAALVSIAGMTPRRYNDPEYFSPVLGV